MHAHARTTRRAAYQQLQNAIVQGGVSSAIVVEPIFEGGMHQLHSISHKW